MTSRNPITGDKIKTKPTTKEYEDNYDKIFGNKNECKNQQCYCTGECHKEKSNDREIQESK